MHYVLLVIYCHLLSVCTYHIFLLNYLLFRPLKLTGGARSFLPYIGKGGIGDPNTPRGQNTCPPSTTTTAVYSLMIFQAPSQPRRRVCILVSVRPYTQVRFRYSRNDCYSSPNGDDVVATLHEMTLLVSSSCRHVTS